MFLFMLTPTPLNYLTLVFTGIAYVVVYGRLHQMCQSSNMIYYNKYKVFIFNVLHLCIYAVYAALFKNKL